ncbi:glutamate--cysteine ligase [Rothia sp. ZJ932]|uniref:glutamate--cysteine ligase n=1 Tax=Rothia sp. ZJ932 TaxID=2810516 RepID=UPI0019676171|nr:glutamate--cysteine ligase [Rothia sp. ZJ932]QRZ62124.1 glutamate--cysteine ligase [Rothia sp. ZJ932]
MIPFSDSAQSTIGVEWELALVDRETRELASRAQEVFTALEQDAPHLLSTDSGAHITGEFLDNTVELVTGVCRTAEETKDQLRAAADDLEKVLEPLDLAYFSAGTHPFSQWSEQPVANKDRYQKIIERTQYWGRQMIIYGVHVHVGVDSRSKVLPVLNGLSNYYPHLLALSASSPYWEGTDTGFASHRSQMFQQLPTAGLPFTFERWEDYEAYIDDLIKTGVIDDPSENRWDLRPVAHFGTVEMRVCDGLASTNDVAAITAFTQCLAEHFSREVEAGRCIEPLHPWHMQENKWRAARYGTDAIIITDNDCSEPLVTDHLREILNVLEPIAADLGCSTELADIERIIDQGPGYQRQRRVAEKNQGDLRAVVDDLIALGRS